MTNEVDKIDLALADDDNGLASLCFVVYRCSSCNVKTCLTWTLDSLSAIPPDAKVGAIVTRYDKKTKLLIRKNVICFPCIKDMRYTWNRDKEDVIFNYYGADDPVAEIQETMNQLKRQAGIPKEEW